MTLRRGVTLCIAVGALLAYTALHLHSTHATIPAASLGSTILVTEPDAGILPIVTMIDDASTSVDLVMYELEDTSIEQSLAADAARGVAVRVILDEGYFGKKENTKNDEAYHYLTGHGVSVHWAPSYFALTHEKSLVIDGKTAVIMTMNFTPQYYASSREFAIIDTDSNDVAAMESTFDDDWNGNNATAANGDDLIWSPESERALIAFINSAHTSLDMYNEEMADANITSALEAAAVRGVVVRIDMTYSSEWKSAFTSLTQAGAQVRTYSPKAPLYIHAKMILADHSRAFVGSENFSSNSLNKNRELGILVTDSAVITSLENTFEKDWASATAFTP
ncbi:MAG TPA: phospholipase D-like domain-containing protein [Candidatus Paceibacterota bacterium]|nr:phospholipase D-like domain-containing protein [Candidatus Paceibacterota bacterium]